MALFFKLLISLSLVLRKSQYDPPSPPPLPCKASLLKNEAVSWIWRSCGDRTDIGKANLWFVLKCRSSPAVILRPFRNGSEPQPSQPIVYVRFDRADAMETLCVDVKCTYHVNSSRFIARRRAPSSLLQANSTHARHPGISNRPGVSSCRGLFV